MNDAHSQHISRQFNVELEEIKTRMMEMGGLVERQVSDALNAFMNADPNLAEQVRRDDEKINAYHSSIDEECTLILARRQPAAGDLRFVLAISKALNDLERIGDEAAKIAVQVLRLTEEGGMYHSYKEIRHIGDHVAIMVRDSLDAFTRFDTDLALAVAQEDRAVDMEYATAMRSLVTYMMEDPRRITSVLSVMWALRSLERIGDHARNIAEHVIYLVKGLDVRHLGLTELAETLSGKN